MRHTWNRSGYTVTTRSCTACWATGSRFGKGSTPWHGTMPDGTHYSCRIPPCPGTPWVRRDGGAVTYWAIGPHNHRIEITPALVTQFGREHVENMVERHGFPPLPADAWKDLEA